MKKIFRKTIASFLMTALMCTMMPLVGVAGSEVDAATNLLNPRIEYPEIFYAQAEYDCIYFGNYPQSSDGNGGFKNEPIKWRILQVNGDEALLLADKIIDGDILYAEVDHDYYEPGDVTWETSNIRKWLNREFISKAFSSSEQNSIVEKTIKTPDTQYLCPDEEEPFIGKGGKDTKDKVFLLSVQEAENSAYGFSEDEGSIALAAENTAYTQSKNPHLRSQYTGRNWYLRSQGYYGDAFVFYNGIISYEGDFPDGSGFTDGISCCLGVRPALYIDLSQNEWSYAGTVWNNKASEHYWEHFVEKAGLLKNGIEYDKCRICGEIGNKKVIKGYAKSYVEAFKVSAGKSSFTAKWKTQSKSNQKLFNGYQIRYSLKSNMSNAKTVGVSKSSSGKTVKSLKAKTKYFVQVRTYTKKDGITFYSSRSKSKAIKTK